MTSEPVRSCFFLLRLFAARVKRSSSYIIVLPLLSALMHRLINWKPRLFATRWTLFGTRRSPTAESPRRTCTARRSGKCLSRRLFFLFLSPFTASPLCLARQKTGCRFQRISYRLSQSLLHSVYRPSPSLFHCVPSLHPSPLIRWSSDPLILLHRLTFCPPLSSHLSRPQGSEKISPHSF